MATVKEINLGDTSDWNVNPLHTSSEQDDTADVEKKKKKRNRNNRRSASENTILDRIKNHDVTFCKLIGCYGIILLLQTLIFSIFYFSLFYLFTYPNFSNTEKEGVIVFVVFGILFVLLFVYALVRWKHRALAMIKKRIGSHSRRTDNLVSRIKNLYSTNFGLNGKYYLYKLYGSETLEKIFQTINYFTIYEKEKFNFAPNLRIDLSYTELSKYRETGSTALVYKNQIIETGMISTGFTVSDVLDFDSLTLKPNGGLEIGLDFSPSSDATYRYLSETTEYTKSIDQDSKNIRANIGFDLITEDGLSIMTIYERNQSDNAHSDTLYLGFGYIPDDNSEYALTFDNDKASLNYNRDLNGFDIKMSSNYNFMGEIPDYGANLEISNKF